MSGNRRSRRPGHVDISPCRAAGSDGRFVPGHECRRSDPLRHQACSVGSWDSAGQCYRKRCAEGCESATAASAYGSAPGGPLLAPSPWGWGREDRTLEAASEVDRVDLGRSPSVGGLGAVRKAAVSAWTGAWSSGRSRRREAVEVPGYHAAEEEARTPVTAEHGTGPPSAARLGAAGMTSAGALALATPEPARRYIVRWSMGC